MKALYSWLGFMVGTRFHSCIFALSEGVPTMAISYQGTKASGIMAEMHLARYHMNIAEVNGAALIERFELLVTDRLVVTDKCKRYMDGVRERWLDLGREINQVLAIKPSPSSLAISMFENDRTDHEVASRPPDDLQAC
jgi:colanic acid/amylovoran biosynthesis protein